jgi:hypothetical protein
MSHLGPGRGIYRLNEIGTHRLGQRVFETYRWISREKGRVVSAVRSSVRLGRRLKEER